MSRQFIMDFFTFGDVILSYVIIIFGCIVCFLGRHKSSLIKTCFYFFLVMLVREMYFSIMPSLISYPLPSGSRDSFLQATFNAHAILNYPPVILNIIALLILAIGSFLYWRVKK